MPTSIRYQFTQRFTVSAQEAFSWCTNFTPDDHVLMRHTNAERKVTCIADGSILLKDTFQTPQGAIEKQKLVALYPDQLRWTSTHLSGPNMYSQFVYQIKPLGITASTLEFTALHIEPDDKANAKALAEKLCREDASAWALLAEALKREKAASHLTERKASKKKATA